MSLLSRFGTYPREGHLDPLLHVFGHSKKWKNKCIAIDSHPQSKPKESHADFVADCDYAIKDQEADYSSLCPEPMDKSLEVSAHFDSDHDPNCKTRQSTSGLVAFMGLPMTRSSGNQHQ